MVNRTRVTCECGFTREWPNDLSKQNIRLNMEAWAHIKRFPLHRWGWVTIVVVGLPHPVTVRDGEILTVNYQVQGRPL